MGPDIATILTLELSGTHLQHNRQLEHNVEIEDKITMKLSNYGCRTRQLPSGARI